MNLSSREEIQQKLEEFRQKFLNYTDEEFEEFAYKYYIQTNIYLEKFKDISLSDFNANHGTFIYDEANKSIEILLNSDEYYIVYDNKTTKTVVENVDTNKAWTYYLVLKPTYLVKEALSSFDATWWQCLERKTDFEAPTARKGKNIYLKKWDDFTTNFHYTPNLNATDNISTNLTYEIRMYTAEYYNSNSLSDIETAVNEKIQELLEHTDDYISIDYKIYDEDWNSVNLTDSI